MSTKPVLMVLGRIGDILNALPIAHEISQKGEKPFFLVAKDFSDVLSGVSYVDPVVWDGDYSNPSAAILWFRKHHGNNPIISAQTYRHSDSRHLTESYQKESWRVAGWLDKFGTLPLVIDNRDFKREEQLRSRLPQDKPWVLVALSSISSPYSKREELLQRVQCAVPTHHVIDLCAIKADRPFDLLGLFVAADLLVCTDTMHLHLSRASKVPVVGITNMGWKGSIFPPSTVAKFNYESPIEEIVSSVVNFFTSKSEPKIVLACDIFGKTKRHLYARKSWEVLTGRIWGVSQEGCQYSRSAKNIGDKRDLPFLKDLLKRMMVGLLDQDIILWTNDDIALDPGIIRWATEHVGRWGSASMRRNSPHIGRDLFGFRVDWLKKYWEEIPDFILGAPAFDLYLASMVRNSYGIKSTKQNMEYDIFPAETLDRFALHENHLSEWAGENEFVYPANIHNQKLFRNYCAMKMPSLKI